MNSKPMVDIIVTHYNEPWEVGRKFFHMLSLQRGIKYEDFRVILVQDGEKGDLNWEELFKTCPYQVDILNIEHAGLSAARNAGIKAATADWVMFCDFDDIFSDVYSVKMILNVLPTNEADILWSNVYREELRRAKSIFINVLEEDFTHIHAKLYRREWMVEHHILFCEKLRYNQDIAFNTLALSETSPDRIKRIKMPFTMYTKTFSKFGYTSVRETVADRIESIYYCDRYLVKELEKRANMSEMRMALAGLVFDMYYLLNSKPQVPHCNEIRASFIEMFRRYKNQYDKISPLDMEVAYSTSNEKMLTVVQDLYNSYLIEPDIPEDEISRVNEWIKTLGSSNALTPIATEPQETQPYVLTDNHLEDEQETVQEPVPESKPLSIEKKNEILTDKNFRAVVYTGTYNVYDDILASLKSLLATTRVDRVYLLIEDDKFTHELPDCVTVVNVKNQAYFPQNGPNFGNAWSYMCLMRAAFPEMFPHLDKILSLDIDVVVTKDIGELWDIDMTDYYLAGVNEPVRQKKSDDPVYVNFGVVMMNLDKMRRDGIGDEAIRMLNTCKLSCPEQDAFNKLCAGHIYKLPVEYNYAPYTHLTGETDHEIIIHYAGMKYWKHFSAVKKYAKMSWDDILKQAEKPQKETAQEIIQEPEIIPQQEIKPQERIAVYCATRTVYHEMLLALRSLLAHTRVDKVYLLIEDDSLPESLPAFVQCINVSKQPYFPESGPNYNNSWSYMVLMRAALTKVLPDVDTVLSLDNDTLVMDDIGDVWNTDLSGSYFAAVQENHHATNHIVTPYYNFGVILFNLAKLRADKMDDKVISALNTTRYAYNEQECMNKLCYGMAVDLSSDYNASDVTAPPQHERIHHYCGHPRNKFRFRIDARKYEDKSCSETLGNSTSSSQAWKELFYQRYDLINRFISERNYKSFLEIGTSQGETLQKVQAPVKVSVDPDPATPATHHMTSDQYFESCTDTFDIVFIDGLHEHHQVWRDIQNALSHLNKDGVIILHDCNPSDEYDQRYSDESIPTGKWSGTVWKAFIKARAELPYESCLFVPRNGDGSCGIIDTSRPKQSDTSSLPTDMERMTWNDFQSHKEWLNCTKSYSHYRLDSTQPAKKND